ncbi:hypothetical protein T484DRAFT_1896100 [Baffinella frigidus]|nr:hypothetical protein T484DRAFT_1896100 [Cryptophyta sp. CCMP2293]
MALEVALVGGEAVKAGGEAQPLVGGLSPAGKASTGESPPTSLGGKGESELASLAESGAGAAGCAALSPGEGTVEGASSASTPSELATLAASCAGAANGKGVAGCAGESGAGSGSATEDLASLAAKASAKLKLFVFKSGGAVKEGVVAAKEGGAALSPPAPLLPAAGLIETKAPANEAKVEEEACTAVGNDETAGGRCAAPEEEKEGSASQAASSTLEGDVEGGKSVAGALLSAAGAWLSEWRPDKTSPPSAGEASTGEATGEAGDASLPLLSGTPSVASLSLSASAPATPAAILRGRK